MTRRVVRPSVRREVDEEFAFHVEMRVRDLVVQGWSEEEARTEAVRRFGDIERVKADCRDLGTRRDERMSRRLWWDETRQDLVYAARQLVRAPAFTAITVLTLAVAIGANTAVFTVVNAVLLKPLPFPEPDALAVVWTRYLPPSGFDIEKFVVSDPEWLDIREESEAFESVAAYVPTTRTLTVEGQEAERLTTTLVSADFFPTLGVPASAGRWIAPEEDAPGLAPVAVIGYELWTDRFGADPAIVGGTMVLNGEAAQVVGIMPEGFDFPQETQVWMPLGVDRSNEGGRGSHGNRIIARRKPGKTMDDAHAELAVFRDRWAAEYSHNVGHFAWTTTLEAEIEADAPATLLLLMSAVGLVLLVACANVANLMLARAERRTGEVAVRAVLGAGRGRLTRQLATESLTLAGLAAAVGLGLAVGGVRAITAAYPTALPRFDEVGVDGTVLTFTLALTVCTALLFGVVPAFLAGRRATASLASAEGRSVGGRRASALRRALVTGEVAVSLVVVILAGLLVQTFAALSGTDPRLDADDLLTFAVTLPPASYPEPARVPADFERLLERIHAVPGVEGVAATSALPFSGRRSQGDFYIYGRPPRQEGEIARNAVVTFVTPGFFATMGVAPVEGREISDADAIDAPLVAVVNQSMADRYWPGESALGQRFGFTVLPDSIPWMTIVGVVPDQVFQRVDEEPYPQMYIPEGQAELAYYGVPRSLMVAARTGIDAASLTPAVRAAVAEFDPALPIYDVQTMRGRIAESLSNTRIVADLLGVFALIALSLAAVGIYGVVSYSVAGRTREIGVRVALGAERGVITRMVLGEGARPVLLGLVAGLTGAWLCTRLVESMLWGVEPTDPLTFSVLPLALLGVAGLASLLPAVRATRVAPTEALRTE